MDKRIDQMKEALICCVESQIRNLDEVNAEELGEVIDMLKDLEEMNYYCAVTKAMEEYGDSKEICGNQYYASYGGSKHHDTNSHPASSAFDGHGDSKYYYQEKYPRMMMENEYEYPNMRDPKEGRSPHLRKMYMEHKNSNMDKAAQMRELESYMQELTQDIVEMIEGATPEEKQYLNKKITALASKIV